MKTKRQYLVFAMIATLAVSNTIAQGNAPSETTVADTSLSRHDFLYAGQSKQRRMFIVRNGEVCWSYDDKLQSGEISDAVLMCDGNILVAHQFGVAEIDADGNTVWSHAAPPDCEIHTVQPIGKNHVVFVQNGHPAKAVVMEIPTCRIVREFEIPTNPNGSVHGQFRNARLSSLGTLLVANMELGCIHEFTSDGNEVNRWTGFQPWSVQEMPATGNLLITGRKGLIQEIDRQGKVVWQLNATDYGVTRPQKTVRLNDGGHIVNNWFNEWDKTPMDSANAPVQAIEVDRSGKLVWQLRAWRNPDLGPSTTIQLLSDAVRRESLFFGEFNGQSHRRIGSTSMPEAPKNLHGAYWPRCRKSASQRVTDSEAEPEVPSATRKKVEPSAKR